MPKGENDIKQTIAEIENAVETTASWPQLQVLGIEKFGKEASVKTNLGDISISIRDLMQQREFVIKVAEEFGVCLDIIKSNIYHKWLAIWFKTLRDLKAEDPEMIDNIEDYLDRYLSVVDEEDIDYLKMGRPVLMPDDEIAFKMNDFMLWLKKELNLSVTQDQMVFLLKRFCKAKQVGKDRTRCWIYKKKENKKTLL